MAHAEEQLETVEPTRKRLKDKAVSVQSKASCLLIYLQDGRRKQAKAAWPGQTKKLARRAFARPGLSPGSSLRSTLLRRLAAFNICVSHVTSSTAHLAIHRPFLAQEISHEARSRSRQAAKLLWPELPGPLVFFMLRTSHC